jgi:hypothetical protein
MHSPDNFSKVVDRKRYSTKTATLIASDAYWDGHNFERGGTNTFLYRTPRGNYFYVRLTQWQGEQDNLIPVSQDDAIEMYEGCLREHEVPYEEAFPNVKVEDA